MVKDYSADISEYGGGKPATIKEINTSVVLNRIRSVSECSKSSLARDLDLSLPSISRIVSRLIDAGYVLEGPLGASAGGKKPTLLRFNASVAYVAGISIDMNHVSVVLSDLSGEAVGSLRRYRDYSGYSADKIISMLREYLERVVGDACVDPRRVEIATVSVPATEDNAGVVRFCPTIPAIEGVKLGDRLSSALSMTVLIENVANSAIVGEVWRGGAGGLKNAVFVDIGSGIGLGIMVNGRIYRGSTGYAGEIGYMFIDRNMTHGEFSPFGQLEYLSSNTAMERIGLLSANGRKSGEYFVDRIDNEEKAQLARGVIDDLALGISNVITILDPEVVVINSELLSVDESLFEYLKSRLRSLAPFACNVVKSVLKERAPLVGAVRIALDIKDREIISPFFRK